MDRIMGSSRSYLPLVIALLLNRLKSYKRHSVLAPNTMKQSKVEQVFPHNKRIRLGIWGLGRGRSFYSTSKFLNMDIVAGCDFNEHMCQDFLRENPGAFATANADEFLAQDFDAVVVATFCPNHAGDAIRCLQAGKHVLSEVTAFHTMAEGVRLVEEVEKRKLIYNLAENFPFSAANMYLARKWKEGLFGELMYAEYEYVHEGRKFCYINLDNAPIQPGNSVHSWRSWLNLHYYCTHSLGPVMLITGTRPTRVVTLPGKQHMAGYMRGKEEALGGFAPSLITMSNGGLVRNLMAGPTSDSHVQRLWGTRGAVELGVGKPLQLRLGAAGQSPKLEVIPEWEELGALAARTGHDGGDFWVLYYFARQIFTGEPAPWNIYAACDVTIPGILAFQSTRNNGRPYDVPDFRQQSERDKYRNDDWAQPRYDTKKGVFPADADYSLTQHFTKTMPALIQHATDYRAYADWKKVRAEMSDPSQLVELASVVAGNYPALRETFALARKIVDAYPASDGARVLREMLELGDEPVVMAAGFLPALKRELATLRRTLLVNRPQLVVATASPVLRRVADIGRVTPPPPSVKFAALPYNAPYKFHELRARHGGTQDGLLYIRGKLNFSKAGMGHLLYGVDGPIKVWVNGKAVDWRPGAKHPCIPDQYQVPVKWKKGDNSLLFAIHTNQGRARGISVRGVID